MSLKILIFARILECYLQIRCYISISFIIFDSSRDLSVPLTLPGKIVEILTKNRNLAWGTRFRGKLGIPSITCNLFFGEACQWDMGNFLRWGLLNKTKLCTIGFLTWFVVKLQFCVEYFGNWFSKLTFSTHWGETACIKNGLSFNFTLAFPETFIHIVFNFSISKKYF